jgi:hypothetical protein
MNCQCCQSPHGQPAEIEGVKRSVCNDCLGFIACWFLDVEATEPTATLEGGDHE